MDRDDLEQFVHDSAPLKAVWKAIQYLCDRLDGMYPSQFIIPIEGVNCVITDLKFTPAQPEKEP